MTSKLPLIRLSSIYPFLAELRRRDAPVSTLLRDLGLPVDIPTSQDLFVAPATIYEFVERSAEITGDPYLGYAVGRAPQLEGWVPISRAAKQANTVGELLTLFIVNATDHSSASNFFLRVDGKRTTFGLDRVVQPAFRPGQNDAFYLGFMSRLLIRATRANWSASDVMFRVADVGCIPDTDEKLRVAKGDRSGIKISFPSQWLMTSFEASLFRLDGKADEGGSIPRSLVESVHTALRPHLHKPGLTADKASRICGYTRRRLAEELRAEGTTLIKEISYLRAKKACDQLGNTERRVADIAQDVGFTDPSVFSRAFKNWTGQSPQAYRRSQKSLN